jgi:putative phosphoesterase
MPSPLRIFVLADTHNRLPANVQALAKDADEIWHLGDVCDPGILETIEKYGPPVTVVRGNCDNNFEWPLVVDLERNGARFRLVHIPPDRAPANVDVLLHGHTHVPRNERRDGMLFLNPGCVTRPNLGAPASVANLDIAADGKLSWQLILLR